MDQDKDVGLVADLIGRAIGEGAKGVFAMAGAAIGGPAGAAAGWAAGAVVDHFGPRVARAWVAYCDRATPQQRDALARGAAGLADLPQDAVNRLAEQVIDQVAPADASAQDRAVARNYFAAVPSGLRRAMTQDPHTGKSTLSPTMLPRTEPDVLGLLPAALPPFVLPYDLPGTPYRLTDLLGTGGFGAVYRARNLSEQYGDSRALKFCLDPRAIETLRRERDLLTTLTEAGRRAWPAGIVRLFHCDLDAAWPYLVYECVEGGDLAAVLTRHRRATGRGLDAPQAAAVVRRIAAPLAIAHARNLVHRDLKPSNVLLVGDSFDAMKLADFGIGVALDPIARQRSQSQSSAAVTFRGAGTPLYMSPEHLRGDKPVPGHDVYALGVIWYQLLAGDVSRPMHPDWHAELREDFAVLERDIELIGRCVGREKNRPDGAGMLLDLLGPEPVAGGAAVSLDDLLSRAEQDLERENARLRALEAQSVAARDRQAAAGLERARLEMKRALDAGDYAAAGQNAEKILRSSPADGDALKARAFLQKVADQRKAEEARRAAEEQRRADADRLRREREATADARHANARGRVALLLVPIVGEALVYAAIKQHFWLRNQAAWYFGLTIGGPIWSIVLGLFVALTLSRPAGPPASRKALRWPAIVGVCLLFTVAAPVGCVVLTFVTGCLATLVMGIVSHFTQWSAAQERVYGDTTIWVLFGVAVLVEWVWAFVLREQAVRSSTAD